LIRPHLGNSLAGGKTLRISALLNSAPQLEKPRIDQIAALPLGGRVRLDPWSNRVELLKTNPVAVLSAQEKMPFEVTPFLPYLTRQTVSVDNVGIVPAGRREIYTILYSMEGRLGGSDEKIRNAGKRHLPGGPGE
jgi:hypothetical protein